MKKAATTVAAKPYAVLIDSDRHTAIQVAMDAKSISIIPMDGEGLTIKKLNITAQEAGIWSKIDYPVRKAAQFYLNSEACKLSTTSSKARAYLEAILADVTLDEDSESAQSASHFLNLGKESKMTTTAKKSAAKKPAAKPVAKKAAAPAAKPVKAVKEKAEGKASKAGLDGSAVLKKGSVDFTTDCRAGSIRYSRMEFIVKHVGKKISDVLGKAVDKDGNVIETINVVNAIKNNFVTV